MHQGLDPCKSLVRAEGTAAEGRGTDGLVKERDRAASHGIDAQYE